MNPSELTFTEASRQTFWKLICEEKYQIRIPRIQRDYAHGREEAEPKQIRQAFLKDVFDALIIGRSMDVNFIYGNKISETEDIRAFVPIDGQQRLTTLFLIHWYFASWPNQLNDETKVVLDRFQYDTRFVAGSFCHKLVNDVSVDLRQLAEDKKSLSEAIKDYYWFFSSYERDATIKAMLTMLQNIHEVVSSFENKDIFYSFFTKLTSVDCPISFLFLDIADVGLTDEIYIKMNARGKALTRFENFKAQLSGYLSEKDQDFSREFIGNINGYWSGFFWHEEYRSDVELPYGRGTRKSSVFDNQIMNLFRFIMFNEYMTRVDLTDDSSELKYLERRVLGSLNKETDFEFFSHLFTDEYRLVAGYKTDTANVDADTFRLINVLLNVLTKRKEETGSISFLDNSVYSKAYLDEEACFKRLIKSVQEKSLSYEEQLLIYAEFMFLIRYAKPDYSFDMNRELTAWIRFVYNITHNMVYNTIDDYLRSAQRIRKIIEENNAHDILDYATKILHKTYAANSGYGFAEHAMKEEAIKAILMTRSDAWKESIISAEQSFLDSQIAALLSFSGAWQIYEDQMDAYESENSEADWVSDPGVILSSVIQDNSYLKSFNTYLLKFNKIFGKYDLLPGLDDDCILRRALLTYGGGDSYMLPAGKPIRCFLDVTDRDNSFKRLFRDDNKKKKSDDTGVRIYFKQLLDDLDETKEIVPQLQSIIDRMEYDEESIWKKYFIEMPEILNALQSKNTDLPDEEIIFKNPKRFICFHNNRILLLEKVITSSNNREYYSYVLYLKAKQAGLSVSYHKDYGEDTAKYLFFVDNMDRTVQVSYTYVEDQNQYLYVAKTEAALLSSFTTMEEMLEHIKSNIKTEQELPDSSEAVVDLRDVTPMDMSSTEVVEETQEQELSAVVEDALVNNNDYMDGSLPQADPIVMDSRDYLISVVFGENKYNLFVKYCEEQGWTVIRDLEKLEFYSLLNVQGIGKGKIDDIIERYNDVIEGKFALSNQENPDLSAFESINDDLLDCSLDYLAGLGVKQKSILKLMAAGYKKIGDLRGVSSLALKQNMTAGDYEKLMTNGENLSKPLINAIEDVLYELSKEQDYTIVLLREDGYSLQAIGDRYSFTREWVRQVIKRFEERLLPFMAVLQKKLRGDLNYITGQQITDIYDNDDYDKILLRWFKDCDTFEYLEFADVFVFLNCEKKHYEKDILALATGFIDEDGIFLNEYAEDLEELMHEKGYPYIDKAAFLNLVQENGYSVHRDFVVKGKKSYAFFCEKIVERMFPNGIKIYDNSDELDMLRKYVLKSFGDVGVSQDDYSLSARLRDELVLCDKGKVTAASNAHVDLSLLEEIKEYIDQSPEMHIYYTALFSVFEQKLLGSGNVNNHHFLHGVLKLYFANEYNFADKDFLTKTGEGLISGKVNDKLLSFIDGLKRPVSRVEIKDQFPEITNIVLANTALSDSVLMQWGYSQYYSMNCLTVTDSDRAFLRNRLEELMAQHDDYCSQNILFDAISEERKEFILLNNISESTNLFYIYSKLFKDEYDFRRPHITKKGRMEELSVKNVMLELMGNPEKLILSACQEKAAELKWSASTFSAVFADIEQDYVRINDNEYVLQSHMSISDEQLHEIEAAVRSKLKYGFVSLLTFDFWDLLPKIGYEWNSYFLRSLIEKRIDDLKIIETRFTDRRYEKGMIVDAAAPFSEYADLVVHVMQELNKIELSEADMCEMLISEGLTFKAIPKELLATDKLKFSDGVFSIVNESSGESEAE